MKNANNLLFHIIIRNIFHLFYRNSTFNCECAKSGMKTLCVEKEDVISIHSRPVPS